MLLDDSIVDFPTGTFAHFVEFVDNRLLDADLHNKRFKSNSDRISLANVRLFLERFHICGICVKFTQNECL